MNGTNGECGQEVRQTVAPGGAALRYRLWSPQDAKGSVVCLHGIRSHGAWYLDSCSRLARSGYRVLFPDRRGSGLNRGVPGAAGARLGDWVADVRHFLSLAARELPGRPVHLLGISWGGRLAVAAAGGGTPAAASVVLSSPGIASRCDCSPWEKVRIAASLLAGAGGDFAIPLQDAELFTDDPDERNYIDEDAFGMRRAGARFLWESRRLERRAAKEFRRLSAPVYLLLAGRDEIVDNDRVKMIFDACASPDKLCKVYPRARHTLEFDSCREEYFADLAAWFDAHGAGPSGGAPSGGRGEG